MGMMHHSPPRHSSRKSIKMRLTVRFSRVVYIILPKTRRRWIYVRCAPWRFVYCVLLPEDTLGVSEQCDAIEETIEPFLLQQGLIQRSSRGRLLTKRIFEHLGLPTPKTLETAQTELLE